MPIVLKSCRFHGLFSKGNIFSGINNLKDITLDPHYSTICGYTQGDLETVFAKHLEGVSDFRRLR